MKQYIALLRGVNVGGKNKLSMALLKAAFEEAGLTNVLTYINSGNILFTSDEPETTLGEKCSRIIEQQFQLAVPVLALPAAELAAALQHAPSWWGSDPEAKHNAIFVIPPFTTGQILEQVGTLKPEYEQVACHGPVIFWSAPLKTFSRTRFSKVAGTAAYPGITIRNANTTKKLLELAGGN